jgi:CheY-like chemotaxis protein
VPRIIVVDDEPVHNLLLGLILEQAGYQACTCESGARALAEVARGCDCLITDYHMPAMDGAQLIRSVRNISSPVCIVLTGSDGDGVEEDAIDAGAVAVLRKPTPADLILQLVGALLRYQCGTAASPAKTGPQRANQNSLSTRRRTAGLY